MAEVRVMVLRSAGTNCDVETAHAFELAGATSESVHVNQLSASPDLLGRYSIVAVPGGFSYGDDISAGRILAQRIETALLEPLRRFVERGGLVTGICNGFQVLVKTALLPGRLKRVEGRATTLAHNDPGPHNKGGGFLCRWVEVEEDPASRCVWTKGVGRLALPMAHGEGRLAVTEPGVLDELQASGRVALRYVGGELGVDLPGGNPNGSAGAVAGLCDETGRVFGLMPHPERHVRAGQHPAWGRLGLAANDPGPGLAVFVNAVKAARGL